MKKLDIIALILLFMMNFYFLRIIFQYDYYIMAFSKESVHQVLRNFYTFGNTIIIVLLGLPRWRDYLRQRQIKIELGDTQVDPFLNYHPEDV